MSLTRPSPRGVTLIESMAAMAVFTIGIIGVMQMNVLASQQNNLARSRTVAAKIARDVADSFERLPFDHPVLSQATVMLQSSPDFDSLDNPDGLVKMQDVPGLTGGSRPMLGAADAAFLAEGDGSFYEIGWRVWRVPNPARNNVVDQLRIIVMVRFPTGANGTRQVSAWAVKTDARIVTEDPQAPEF